LADDGNTLAVGAFQEASAATGVGGDQSDNSVSGAGAAYVFSRTGATWRQDAYLKASNPEMAANFGLAVAIAGDGSTIAVGAIGEASRATGIDGDQTDVGAPQAGAAYVFVRTDATWMQRAYVKATNTDGRDFFGFRVGLSGDGRVLAVGASQESSSATGVGGDGADNSATQSGAAYIIE